MVASSQQIIEQTKKWIAEVVIDCNFCPFAARVVKQKTVFYTVEPSLETAVCLESFLHDVSRLDNDDSIETGFIIFSNAFKLFYDYLDMVELAEKLLKQKKYNGIYQLASFHPRYLFTDATENDAANYTNRSPYPMLHLLRESSIDRALENYQNPEDIPQQNIKFTREKGVIYMKMLRDNCLKI